MFDVKGKSVLITGAGRGLGRALALTLGDSGARIFAVARTQRDVDEVVDLINERGGTAFGVSADVGEKESIYPIVGQAAALAGPVDLLINNASILGSVPLQLLPDTECEDFERVLGVNLLGPFRLIKAVAGSMAVRQTGLIINITSDAAVAAYPTWGAYSISKAGLDHLTRIFAAELVETRIRLLSLDPGEMKTRMYFDAVPDADPAQLETPETVAGRITSIIRESDKLQSGSRIVVKDWKVSHEASASAS